MDVAGPSRGNSKQEIQKKRLEIQKNNYTLVKRWVWLEWKDLIKKD